jgi:ribonuclease HI
MKKRLAGLQRKVLLMLTRSMRGTPTAGMEVALGIPPLHLWLKKRGLETRIRVNHDLSKLAGATNSRKVGEATEGRISTDLPLDHIKEIGPAKKENDIPPSGRKYTAYTDGSRKEERTGYAWLFTRGLQVIAEGDGYLGETGTVFQAEIAAINAFLEWLNHPDRKEKLRRGDSITIKSDSQSGIAALTSRLVTSKLVKECRERLAQSRKTYNVTVEWVRGHDDDTGNEAADAAAKTASEEQWQGAEPWGPVPLSWMKRRLEREMEREWGEEWEKRADCRQSKAMLGRPTTRTWTELRNEPREKLRRWTGFVTGHTHMRRHLALILEKEDADIMCRLCGEGPETPLHMMICQALEYKRIKYVAIRNFFTVKESLFTYIDDVWQRIFRTQLNDTPPDVID